MKLLTVISGLLEVTDPRSRNPLTRGDQGTSLDEMVESFIGTPYAETTAALTVLRELVPDELTQFRIQRELARRRHPMPAWLTGLDQARGHADVWFLTHVLGDDDSYLLGVALPSGHELTALIHVDHNLGTVVTDAFVMPEPLEDLALKVGTNMDDPDTSLTRTDATIARAVVERAIDHGSLMFPPLTSDSWPSCRPLVRWMLRHLPPGGVAPEPKEWSDDEMAAIAAEFFASPFGAPVDGDDERSLMESVLWFGTGYAPGDPFRWSPVTIEILLADWFPRKVIADPPFLSKLPDLLRAYVRYCHDRQGIRTSLTEQTLAAVDEYEPEYQRVIRSARPQGPEALLAGMFAAQAEHGYEERDIGEIMLEGLERKVGGRIQLRSLDPDPLPDEPFEWAGVAQDIRPVVQEMLDTCDRCADELLDVEHRTAMRRFLSRAAVGDPAAFRRKASPVRGAASVAWVICRANETAGSSWSDLQVQELLAWFGVKGSVSQRAEALLRANGVDPYTLYGSMDLGAPDLLTSNRRAAIIAIRDRWLAMGSGAG